MSNRILRTGLLALPLLATSFALVTACSDDDSSTVSPDASPDAVVASDGSANDSAAEDAKGDTDADATTVSDGGADSGNDADANVPVLPPLCNTYSNAVVASDPDSEPPDMHRWDLVAFRAVIAAGATCEIGASFSDPDGDPIQWDCFGKQLAGLVGCAGAVDYTTSNDGNGSLCAPTTGASVEIGFRNTKSGGYHAKDFDHFAVLVRDAAVTTGVSAADADRLIGILQAQKNKVVVSDAGAAADGGGYSQACD